MTCLIKIKREIDIEIIVVDNNSTNGYAVDGLKTEFPDISVIRNSSNLGFGEANNIGVRSAGSSNILILNPDTIISKDIILNGIQYLSDIKFGAVAVRMIDGKGDFLQESRRGFPSVLAAIYKFVGLDKIFPNSSVFNQYYLGSKDDIETIEVMSGACFFMRREVYDEIGGFDNRFFMYGEDIDLSYQLYKHGYQIKYISKQSIVHFKGKSSSKVDWNYQTAFYNAMNVYWTKNFGEHNGRLNALILEIAIFLLKIASIFKHIVIAAFWPIIDSIVIYFSITILSDFWASYVKNDPEFFPKSFYTFILPLYTLTWVFSLFVSSFYQRTIEIVRLFKGSTIGSIMTLIIYFLLPSEYKFSRGILIISIGLKFLIPLILRIMSQFFSANRIQLTETALFTCKFESGETNRLDFSQFLTENSNFEVVNESVESNNFIIEVEKSNNKAIIESIESQKNQVLWLYSSKGNYLIQSLGKSDNPNIIAKDTNLNSETLSNRFMKRSMDIGFSIAIVITSIFQIRKLGARFRNAIKVLFKGWTWISIENSALRARFNLKPGIYSLTHLDNSNSELKYLRHYSVTKEFSILLKQMFKL